MFGTILFVSAPFVILIGIGLGLYVDKVVTYLKAKLKKGIRNQDSA
jgi:hypothetical protein